MTGPEDEPGINGGLLQRPIPAPAVGQGTNAFVCTVGVGDDAQTRRRESPRPTDRNDEPGRAVDVTVTREPPHRATDESTGRHAGMSQP